MNTLAQPTASLTVASNQADLEWKLFLDEAVNTHLERRQRKNKPPMSEQEIAQFREDLEVKLSASDEDSVNLPTPEDERQARLDAAFETAKQLGVKFIHRREQHVDEKIIESHDLTPKLSRHVTETRLQNATCGGSTIAYVYHLDDENNLSMHYTVAICRADEAFDPLIGMEESLKKFIKGDLLEEDIVHDRLGHPKLSYMTEAYKSTYHRTDETAEE